MLKMRIWVWRLRYVILVLGIGGFVQQTATLITPDSIHAQMVVAAHEIPAGTTLQASDLMLASAPQAVPGSAHISDFLGLTTVVSLEAGFPLHSSLLAGDHLWRDAPPGTTVVAVDLADATLIPLLQVGDRIDLYSISGNWDSSESLKVATNAHILAIIEPINATGGLINTEPIGATYSLLIAISEQDANLVTGASSQVFRATISPTYSEKN